MTLLGLPVWLIWLIVAVGLVLVDLTLVGSQFILVACGLAAVVTATAAAAGIGWAGQAWVFVIATLLAVPVMIRLFRTRFAPAQRGPRAPGWERGARVTVVRQGDRLVGKLQGDTYPIVLDDRSEPVEGETLIVDRMEGITLYTHRAH